MHLDSRVFDSAFGGKTRHILRYFHIQIWGEDETHIALLPYSDLGGRRDTYCATSIFSFWGEDETHIALLPYSAETDFCALLPSVITSVLISAFPRFVLSVMHSYIINRNDFLHTDGGPFLRPTA